jgi:hypothetical protein
MLATGIGIVLWRARTVSDILVRPAYQPFFQAIGLLIYAGIVAVVATACGALVGGIGYPVFRKSPRRVVGLGLPSLMAVSTICVLFPTICCGLYAWVWTGGSELREKLATPRQAVSEEDILGTWTLDSASLERMEDEGGYEISTHTLTFRDDGTFDLLNMPDWCGPGGGPAGGFYSTSGTWKLTGYEGEWQIFVHFDSVPEFPDGVYTQFAIGGQEPPYYIWMYAGDPDAGRVMVFEKQGSGP